jgi:hypothetical protein
MWYNPVRSAAAGSPVATIARGRLGERTRPVGHADLIGDYPELVALGGETPHGQQEIPSAQTVNPARAEDERAADLCDRAFSLELGCAIHIERAVGASSGYGVVRAPSNT